MADYHPLILRAVEGLDKNTGENRRALYERARTALVAQLRGVVPALDESEITRERLALEEAIRKVEAESGRAAPARSRASRCRRGPLLRRRAGMSRCAPLHLLLRRRHRHPRRRTHQAIHGPTSPRRPARIAAPRVTTRRASARRMPLR